MYHAVSGITKDVIMQDIEKIKEQVGFNVPADEAQIKICNIKLKQNNLPELPLEYISLLKNCNGFSNEDCSVFGAEIKNNNWYKDIAAFNISYFHGKSSKWLILGENDFFYFIYDDEQKKYYVADRDNLEEERSDNDFYLLLEFLLRIE